MTAPIAYLVDRFGQPLKQGITIDPATGALSVTLVDALGNMAPSLLTISSAAKLAAKNLAGGSMLGMGTITERQLGPAIPLAPFGPHDGDSGDFLLVVNKSTVNTNSKTFKLRIGSRVLASINANTAWSYGTLEWSLANQGATNAPSGWLKFTGDDAAVPKLATFNFSNLELKNGATLQLTFTASATADVVGIAGRNLRLR